MEKTIALAVPFVHTSCSESPERAFPRVRPAIPAALIARVQGTTVPNSGPATAFAYGMDQTTGTTKDAPLGSSHLEPSGLAPPDRSPSGRGTRDPGSAAFSFALRG